MTDEGVCLDTDPMDALRMRLSSLSVAIGSLQQASNNGQSCTLMNNHCDALLDLIQRASNAGLI